MARWIQKNQGRPGNPDTPEAYWEIKIEESNVTGMLSLLITDFAADDEEEKDLRGIWDDNFERLHRVSGF